MCVCPKCGSKKIFRFKLDSDWSYGLGMYEPVNERENYTDTEYRYDACDRPDIDLCHCRSCDALWE